MISVYFSDPAKRKVLPAWIREGLERIEQEKRRRNEIEHTTGNENAQTKTKSSESDVVPKSKFVSLNSNSYWLLLCDCTEASVHLTLLLSFHFTIAKTNEQI